MLRLWNAGLETGIPKIDEQHKELFRQIETLMDKTNSDRLQETIDFLGNYVVKHFNDEQGIQAAARYPKAEAHKKFHVAFTARFRELKKKFEDSGSGHKFEVLTEINRTAVGWLKDHIMVHDKEFAAYYKQRQAARPLQTAPPAAQASAQASPRFWGAELETGIPKLDAQHRELFRRIESLGDKPGTGQAAETLDGLGEYAARHFRAEEKVQAAIGYPEAREHKRLHDGFEQKFLAMKTKVAAAAPDQRPEAARDLDRALAGWFRNHILARDQDFADYYLKHRRAAGPKRGFFYRLFHPWGRR